MTSSITIHQIYTNTLSCEPLLERMPNGELLCLCQCDGVTEPAPENRVYAFHSRDNGQTWTKRETIYPEDGQAVYCTELSVVGNEVTAYLTVHSGRFLDWKCFMMKSYDSGYTWQNAGSPPHFPEYTFIRARLNTSDGRILIPYHTYPVTRQEHDRILREEEDHFIGNHTRTAHCESGVLESRDGGQTWLRHPACYMPMAEGWIWAEPTIAELSDGRIVMLMRKDRSGWLYRCESTDGGATWGETVPTDIPNPGNKPRLIPLNKGRIALIHTPNNAPARPDVYQQRRYPLELWITEDDMRTWHKTRLTDFPGNYSYSDGIYENGHLRFVIEHNRHTILYFDVEV